MAAMERFLADSSVAAKQHIRGSASAWTPGGEHDAAGGASGPLSGSATGVAHAIGAAAGKAAAVADIAAASGKGRPDLARALNDYASNLAAARSDRRPDSNGNGQVTGR